MPILSNEEISRLDPVMFTRGPGWSGDGATQRDVEAIFHKLYAPAREAGANAYDLDRIAAGIFNLRDMIVRAREGRTGGVCVEIGSGTGNKSFTICDLFDTYVGIEIDGEQHALCVARAKSLGVENCAFVRGNAMDVVPDPAGPLAGSPIDVLMLYAVLEHLTPQERVSMLALASTVLDGGGMVCVFEAPNRIIPSDAHTSESFFYNQIPEHIAREWGRRHVKHESIKSLLASANHDDYFRAGTGLSHHEFQLAFGGDLGACDFVVDGFDVALLNLFDFSFQEFIALGTLEHHVPDVPPTAFCRSWIDFIAKKRIGGPRRKTTFISPFAPKWLDLSVAPKAWDSIGAPIGKERTFELPEGTISELTIILSGEDGELSVALDDAPSDDLNLRSLWKARPRRWSSTLAVAWRPQRPISTLRLSTNDERVRLHGVIARHQSPDP